MKIKKCISSGIGYVTLFVIGILAILAGIFWAAITAVWNVADRMMRLLER